MVRPTWEPENWKRRNLRFRFPGDSKVTVIIHSPVELKREKGFDPRFLTRRFTCLPGWHPPYSLTHGDRCNLRNIPKD